MGNKSRTPKKDAHPFQLLARVIRGLEWVGAAEIEGRLKANVLRLGHREIRFQTPQLDPMLLELGSVDDVFLVAADARNIDHTRASLRALAAQAAAVDFHAHLAFLKQLRRIPSKPSFSVVASFLGRRNYNRFEIEKSLADGIQATTRWRYLSKEFEHDEQADILIRAHLSEGGGFIGLRLAQTPLHRRPYKGESRTGTLHPPVAFAMAMLAGLREGSILLDPCCGVGTISIEASILEPRAQIHGSDLEVETIRKARANAQKASQPISFFTADAARLPLADASVDRVVCNPPWDRAVPAQGFLADDAGVLLQEVRRVLRPEGRAALIAEPNFLERIDLHLYDLKIEASIPISLFGVWPSLYLLSPRKAANIDPIDADGCFGKELLKYWPERGN